jgi:PHD/YefM family antitoxin component YafN of YafNO toxin-antitoxin module
MNLDELIKKRDELREQVAILNLKYVLGYLNAEEFQNLSIQKDSLKDLESEILKAEQSQK